MNKRKNNPCDADSVDDCQDCAETPVPVPSRILQTQCEADCGSTGVQCKRLAVYGALYCRQHGSMLRVIAFERYEVGLYDESGRNLLAEALPKETTAKVLGQQITLRLTDRGQALSVTYSTATSDLDVQSRAQMERMAQEFAARWREIDAIRLGVTEMTEQASVDFVRDINFEASVKKIADRIKRMGLKQKEAEPFGPNADAEVKYTEVVFEETVNLPKGLPCQLPFFRHPVVFLTRPQQVAPGQTPKCNVSVSQRLVERKTTLSKSGPWTADRIRGTYTSGWRKLVGEAVANGGVVVSDGEVFVVTQTRHCVVVFDLNGKHLRKFGTEGEGEGQFNSPQSIAVSGDLLFITDTGNSRVVVTDRKGKFVRSFGTLSRARLNSPTGIAVSGDHVYIVDTRNNRVVVHQQDGSFVRTFGHTGEGDGQFRNPSSIAVLPADVAFKGGRLFVTDARNSVSVHALDGTFLRSFSSRRAEDSPSACLRGIAVAGDRIFVSDSFNNRVSVHAPNGTIVREIPLPRNLPPGAIFVAGTSLYVRQRDSGFIYVFK